MSGHEVTLYMYDISRGMAAAMGPAFGLQLEAIWHTSVVVYGREYFYVGNAGVMDSVPEGTDFGQPVDRRAMGRTQVLRSDFEAWNRRQEGDRFGPTAYNLLHNNCNHYSNEALMYLVNQRTPDTVYNLTQSVLSSPIGQLVAPMLNAMTGGMGDIASQMQNFTSGLGGGAGARRAAPQAQPHQHQQPPQQPQPHAASSTFGGAFQSGPAAAGAAGVGGASSNAPRQPNHWCHMCDKRVYIQSLANGSKRCIECKEEFVEKLDDEEEGTGSPPQEAAGGSQGSPRSAGGNSTEDNSRTYDPRVNADRFPNPPSAGAAAAGGAGSSAGGVPTGEIPVDMIMQALGQGLAGLQQAAAAGNDATFNMPADSPITHMVSSIAQGIQQLLQQVPPGVRAHLSNQRIDQLPREVLTVAIDEPCVVCHEPMGVDTEVINLSCGHVYHSECITEWLRHRSNCPTCRQEI